MKNVYDQNDKYGPEASELDQSVYKVLKPIFTEWVNKGYSPRQLSHVMQGTITELELFHMIGDHKGDAL